MEHSNDLFTVEKQLDNNVHTKIRKVSDDIIDLMYSEYSHEQQYVLKQISLLYVCNGPFSVHLIDPLYRTRLIHTRRKEKDVLYIAMVCLE